MKAFLPPALAAVLGLVSGAAALGGSPLAPPVPALQPVVEVEQSLPPAVELGAAVPVEIRVRNVGQLAAADVKVIDVLPAGYQLRDASAAPTRLADRMVWPIGTLAPGENAKLQLTLQPTQAAAKGPLRNNVEVTFRIATASAATCPVLAPDLVLSAGPPEEAAPGVPARLTLTIRNQGTAQARNVSLQTLLPPGLLHPRGSDLESNLDTLSPGESRTLPLEVTPQRAGEWSIRMTLQCQGMAPVVQDLRMVVQDVRLSATFRGPESLQQQFTGLFELTIRNDGNSSARQVSLTVSLPEGMSFLRATSPGSYDKQTRTLVWNLGELRPLETRTVAWNSVALQPGDLEGKVRLHCGSRICQESSWKTRVAPEEPGVPTVPGGD